MEKSSEELKLYLEEFVNTLVDMEHSLQHDNFEQLEKQVSCFAYLADEFANACYLANI